MIRDDEQWLALTDAFHAAAFDQNGWYEALEGLAEATGSAMGQLIGLGADAAVPFNIMTNADPDANRIFVEARGGDPQFNPRVRAGMNAPVLQVLAESDFITPDEYKRDAHYQEFAIPWGVPYICLCTLERRNDMLIGLSVSRSEREGHISDKQREIFTSLAPHVRAAVRTQLALEDHGAALLVGAMDAVSMPAFVCDRQGQVCALSAGAEKLLSSQRGLQLRQGRLKATNPAEQSLLQRAIDAVVARPVVGGAPTVRSVVVHYGPANASYAVLDIVGMPVGKFDFNFAPRVLILARSERGQDGRRSAILQVGFALTSAEIEVALHIARGRSPDAIATIRHVSVGTVRIQIKSILAKMGLKRQVELVAKINEL